MTEINSPKSPGNSRQSSSKKIVGCGCGALAFVAVVIFAVANYLGISAEKPMKEIEEQSTPAPQSTRVKLTFPKKYLGLWKSKSGASIRIRPDGKADFSDGDLEISGAAVLIDEKKKILKISSEFDISITWKIDTPPQKETGAAAMKLASQTFRRAP